jgi:hypothetical protein
MRALLQAIADLLWPERSKASATGFPADVYLRPLIILMIVLLAGPDIFAVTELATILELFGATMFLLTFAVGFWIVGIAAFDSLRQFLLPIEHVALIRMRRNPVAIVNGVLLIGRQGLYVFCLGLSAYAWICGLQGALFG